MRAQQVTKQAALRVPVADVLAAAVTAGAVLAWGAALYLLGS